MVDKRPSDIWNEIAKDEEYDNKVRAESFIKATNNDREGISARREKFIKDLNTGSPKILPPNKRDNN